MASIREIMPWGQRWRGGRDNQPSSDDVQPQPEPEPEDLDVFVEMTLQEHLEELRKRITYAVLAVLGALVIGLFFANTVLDKIREQAQTPAGMQTLSPTEPFIVWMKVALYIAIAIAMPVLIYQLMAFVSPGLTRRERRTVYIAIPFVFLSFVAGVTFAFFVLLPRALDFLSGFQDDVFAWNPSAESVIQFYLTLMLGVGLMFELPIVMFALAKVGAMTAKRYGAVRKYALLLVMVAAAIITPTPDPFNMMLVAVPMYALYEIGVLISRFARRE
jgi:sec-independent protein translocase protein TatC